MPNLDYEQLATKTDVSNLGVELRGEMTELRTDLRGEMSELRADIRTEMAELRGDVHSAMGDNVKTIVLANLGISLALGGFIVGLA